MSALALVMNNPRFNLGSVVITPGVQEILETMPHQWANAQVESMLYRHATGDWGLVCPEDAELNEQAADHGDRVLSVYMLSGEKVWVCTESDRSVTTLLLPSEY